MREFTGFSKVVLLLSTLFLLLMFHVSLCNAFLSVPCSLVVAYWEGAGLLALLCVVFSCVFVAFLCCVLGRVWCLVVFFCFVALRPKSTAMVIAGRSVHLTTLFPGQA